VCAPCWRSIVFLTPPCCLRCADPLPRVRDGNPTLCPRCVSRPALVDIARAIGAYEGTLKAIIHALKYDGRRSLAPRLARLMTARHADVLKIATAAVPVPLHPSRRRERGFNQAEDLARHLGIPVVRALRRSRRTSVQAELPSALRAANVHGAFTATDRASGLAGCGVVVVDDVSTTGATIDACATALKAAGVGRVYALTAARVVTRPR
jgi:ComF family protein